MLVPHVMELNEVLLNALDKLTGENGTHNVDSTIWLVWILFTFLNDLALNPIHVRFIVVRPQKYFS